ncbi:MAG: peptidoglycan bridge formation glycyltransferase FemA/FemB family protein [Bacteroidales bacterium]|nr:peptidoglycan bridge formation glycyltransferase FemA/FemB family protein [Bacteroidales bacterium]
MRIVNSLIELSLKEDSFPIFFWDKWKTVEEQLHQKQRLLCVDDEQNVVPFTVYTMSFFKKGDYLYAPLDKNGERLSVEKEKQFLDEFHLFVKHENLVDVMFPPSHLVVFQSVPPKVFFYEIGILVVDLKSTEDQIFTKINPKTRSELRKAELLGVNVNTGIDNIESFYQCFSQTVKKKSIASFSKEYFAKMAEYLGENVFFTVARLENEIEASLFGIVDKKNMYPSYAGTSYSPKYKGSNKFLIWSLYKFCRSLQLEKFIYGGYRKDVQESDPLFNIQKFKLRLGCDIEEGYHFIKVIHPFKYNLVTFALRVKSLLTGRDCSFVNLKGLDVKKSN